MSEYEKYLESYFTKPTIQHDCLMEIAQVAWVIAESLEDYDHDYIQDLIEIYSETDSEDDIVKDKITVYKEVDTHISEDIIDFRNGLFHFHKAFFQQKARVVNLIKDNNVLYDVTKVIAIIEVCLARLENTLLEYEADLCYSSYDGYFEELEKRHGKNAIKYFKKNSELTTEEYDLAFEEIIKYIDYINENKVPFRLNELAQRLTVSCELKIDSIQNTTNFKPENKDHEQISLIHFMQKYCEKQTIHLLRCRRKSLTDANFRRSLTLPKPIKNWKTGQAKYYNVDDLKKNWPEYCEILPNLPPLKQA
jgi:hypothetical protein